MKKILTLCAAVLSSASIWAETATFEGTNLDAPKTIGDITLSLPASNAMSYSNNTLSAGGSGKTFTLTATDALISQVVLTTNNNNNRYSQTNISNSSNVSSETVNSVKVYTITYSTPATTTNITNNGGGVGVTKIVVTYAPSCSAPTSPAITGTTAYTEGDDISLTASASNAEDATFAWYKGADWATASAGSSIGSEATLAISECATSDAGTYWCEISNGTGCEVQVSQSITVAAKPVDNPVITGAVNEAGYGSVAPASITVTSGDEVSISSNVLTCGGLTLTATAADATAEYTYAFESWSGVANGDEVTTNLTVTANFTRTANSYTLAWDANGGDDLTGSYTNGSTAFGAEIITPNTPTRDGYLFTGWAETAEGDVVDIPSTMPAANKTYYAQWMEQIAPTITFNNGTYKVSNQTLDLSSLFSSNSEGAVTYAVKTDGGTSATINGKVFFAFKAGSCVVTASQAAEGSYAEATTDATITVTEDANLLIMVRLSGSAGATKTYAGSAMENASAFTQNLSSGSPYKLSNDFRACVAITLSEGYFQAGDSVVMDLSKTGQMYCGTLPENKDSQKAFPSGTTSLGTTTKTSGIEYFILPNDLPENTTNIFTSRSSSSYNGTLTYMAVYRLPNQGVASALDNTEAAAKAVKHLVNGQLIIEKNGQLFNILGGRIR